MAVLLSLLFKRGVWYSEKWSPMASVQYFRAGERQCWDWNPGSSDMQALIANKCDLPSLLYLPWISPLEEEFLAFKDTCFLSTFHCLLCLCTSHKDFSKPHACVVLNGFQISSISFFSAENLCPWTWLVCSTALCPWINWVLFFFLLYKHSEYFKDNEGVLWFSFGLPQGLAQSW